MTDAGAAGPRPALGITLIVAMGLCFAGMDSSVRWLGGALPLLLLLTVRYSVQALTMGLWLALDRRRSFHSARPGFQALRGALLLLTSACGFAGLQYMPVAEFTAILMLTPVLVTLLAPWLLKESVSALRWALVAGGCIGALIVIRPGSGLFGWPVLFPLACTCCNAAFQVMTSRLSAFESPYTTHFWTGFTGAAVMLPLLLTFMTVGQLDLPAIWATASATQLGLLLLIGMLGTVGHLMLILALGMAPTATLMPFVYTQIATATLLGWLVFRQLPDTWGWVGMAVIAACGAASAWLNVRSASAAQRPLSVVAADTIID